MNDIKGNALSLMQNEELIALNQNTLGQQAYVVQKSKDCYVLTKDMEEANGKKRAIAVYNPTNSQKTVTVKFEWFDLGGNIRVRDLFERNDKGIYSESMDITVPAHGTRIYALDADVRMERTIYEAETAWLSAYQEIFNNQSVGTAIYQENAN